MFALIRPLATPHNPEKGHPSLTTPDPYAGRLFITLLQSLRDCLITHPQLLSDGDLATIRALTADTTIAAATERLRRETRNRP